MKILLGMWRIKNKHCFDWFSPITLVLSGQITQPQPNQQHSIFGKAEEWKDLSILLQHLSTCTTCADKELFWKVASLQRIGFASHYHFANIPTSKILIYIFSEIITLTTAQTILRSSIYRMEIIFARKGAFIFSVIFGKNAWDLTKAHIVPS